MGATRSSRASEPLQPPGTDGLGSRHTRRDDGPVADDVSAEHSTRTVMLQGPMLSATKPACPAPHGAARDRVISLTDAAMAHVSPDPPASTAPRPDPTIRG